MSSAVQYSADRLRLVCLFVWFVCVVCLCGLVCMVCMVCMVRRCSAFTFTVWFHQPLVVVVQVQFSDLPYLGVQGRVVPPVVVRVTAFSELSLLNPVPVRISFA